MARGGTAYAMLPLRSQVETECSQTIEIVASGGQSCGTATFGFGGTCQMEDIAVGYDGTVIQSVPRREETCQYPFVCKCGWRWWRGFLG
jgi:hypothetical protein